MNTLREAEPEPRTDGAARSRKKKKSRAIHQILNGEFLTRDGLINHLPFIGFLAFLFLFHISLMYYFEHMQLEMSRKKSELNEIRSAYNTAMSELERRRQQSSIATDIAALGLKELRTPPQIIDVKPGFLHDEN